MRARGEEFSRLGATLLVVTFEPAEVVAQRRHLFDGPWTVLIDADRAAYRAFGLRRGSVRALINLPAARAYLRGLLRGRMPVLRTASDTAQLGGDFVLDAHGTVVLTHVGRTATDSAPVDELLNAVRSISTTP